MKERRNKLNIQEGQTETFHYEPMGGVTQKVGVRRVAAYCRVSTLAEEQELSFETQSAYYKGLIEKDPTMVLVGIYGDQGFSGLHASRRKEFLRLIDGNMCCLIVVFVAGDDDVGLFAQGRIILHCILEVAKL